LHWPGVPIPVDVVVNPKKSVLKVEFAELEKEISHAFEVIQKSLARTK
jgi:RNase P protein component